jgi:hypothetical protein
LFGSGIFTGMVMKFMQRFGAGALMVALLVPMFFPTMIGFDPSPINSLEPEADPDYFLPLIRTADRFEFLETFDGDPNSPLAWNSPDWDLTVHTRDKENWYSIIPMDAGHNQNCDPPPTTHRISAFEDTVYQCRNHLMTAINDTGYGLIYLTPNHTVDFYKTEAVIRFDISTFRTSERDWFDLWITPYPDHLQLPLDSVLPDLSGEPKNGVHIRMDYANMTFGGRIFRDFQTEEIPLASGAWQGYDSFLEPSLTKRDTFELRISESHIKFGMPDYGFYWIDTAVTSLGWTEGVLQIGHHSYNPTKCSGCSPGTWHWDNIYISSGRPFDMIKADRRYVNAHNNRVSFSAAAPESSHLRFSGIGNNIQVSFNNGLTWQSAQVQPQKKYEQDKFWSYWIPVPAGVQTVRFRSEDWWGGDWHIRDISIWSR